MFVRLRLLLFAGIGGALTGGASWAFLRSLEWATRTRTDHGWLVWLLPVVGITVGAAYHYLGGRAKGGTPAVIEQGHLFTHGVPARMAPMIFGGSVLSHLAGASVGREGTALQMAGSLSDTAARLGRLSAEDRRTGIAASLAGGWGAVYGVPITGVVFMLQVTRRQPLRALAPAVVAAFTGHLVVTGLGFAHHNRPHVAPLDWTWWMPGALIAAGVAFGLLARVFVWGVHATKAALAHRVAWPPARPIVGAVATLALMGLAGRDSLGLSTHLITDAFAGQHIDLWVPWLKLLFTVVALGTGFVGGEVTPLLVMGGTMGGSLAPGLHVPQQLLSAVGTSAVYASAASVMLTGVVLSVEQFGWNTLIPALLVGATARLTAGKPGLYIAHH